MVVVPRGVAHKNVGHGPNPEIVIPATTAAAAAGSEDRDDRLR